MTTGTTCCFNHSAFCRGLQLVAQRPIDYVLTVSLHGLYTPSSGWCIRLTNRLIRLLIRVFVNKCIDFFSSHSPIQSVYSSTYLLTLFPIHPMTSPDTAQRLSRTAKGHAGAAPTSNDRSRHCLLSYSQGLPKDTQGLPPHPMSDPRQLCSAKTNFYKTHKTTRSV